MQAIPLMFQGMEGIGTALSVASGVVGLIGAQQMSGFQAKVAERNAQLADENAKRALHDAAVQAQNRDLDSTVEMGDLLANLGASGLAIGTGSAALRRKSQAELARRDRGYIIQEGEMAAHNYRQQAQDFRTEASGAKAEGKWNMLSGALDLGSTLITGASKVNQAKAKRVAAGA